VPTGDFKWVGFGNFWAAPVPKAPAVGLNSLPDSEKGPGIVGALFLCLIDARIVRKD
jgi:hypothetical protein